MILKASLPSAHFSSVLLLKEQMIISVKKVKNVHQISTKPINYSRKICPEHSHEIGRFLPIVCQQSLPQKFPRNQPIFL